jgi:hypothetical protein
MNALFGMLHFSTLGHGWQCHPKEADIVLYFLIFSIFYTLTLGCAIAPISNYGVQIDKPQTFTEDVIGKIIVNDNTGYNLGSLDYVADPGKQIVNEIKSHGTEFINDENGPTFTFTYYPCEFKEYFPTNYPPINGILHAFTIGFWPVGSRYSCKVDLDVKESSSKDLRNFSLTFEAQKGGIGLFIWADFVTMGAPIKRIRYPVRVLLREYQRSSNL